MLFLDGKITQSSFTHNIEIRCQVSHFLIVYTNTKITADANQEVKDKLAIFIELKSWRESCPHESSSLEHTFEREAEFQNIPNTIRAVSN